MAFNAKHCLKLEILQNNTTLSLPNANFILTTKNPTVDTWENDSITGLMKGDKVYVKSDGSFSKDFKINGSAKIVSGNFLSLLDDGAGDVNTPLTEDCFFGLLANQVGLKSISADCLPSTTLAKNCYYNMFSGTGLTEIPDKLLPSMTLAEGCYTYMFSWANSLKEFSPDLLPAKILVKNCYNNMFAMCEKLEKGGFHGTTFATDCIIAMFNQCPLFKEVTVDFTTWPTTLEGECWLYQTSETGDFYVTNRILNEMHGDPYCPVGWTFQVAPIRPSKKKVEFIVAGLHGVFED